MKRRPLAERVVRPSPRPAGSKNVLPRYVSVGNAKKVYDRRDACDGIPEQNRGRVVFDLNARGDVIGVAING